MFHLELLARVAHLAAGCLDEQLHDWYPDADVQLRPVTDAYAERVTREWQSGAPADEKVLVSHYVRGALHEIAMASPASVRRITYTVHTAHPQRPDGTLNTGRVQLVIRYALDY